MDEYRFLDAGYGAVVGLALAVLIPAPTTDVLVLTLTATLAAEAIL